MCQLSLVYSTSLMNFVKLIIIIVMLNMAFDWYLPIKYIHICIGILSIFVFNQFIGLGLQVWLWCDNASMVASLLPRAQPQGYPKVTKASIP